MKNGGSVGSDTKDDDGYQWRVLKCELKMARRHRFAVPLPLHHGIVIIGISSCLIHIMLSHHNHYLLLTCAIQRNVGTGNQPLEWFNPHKETVRLLPISLPPSSSLHSMTATCYDGYLCIIRGHHDGTTDGFYLDIPIGSTIDDGAWRLLPILPKFENPTSGRLLSLVIDPP
jgi:hypothetical protein